MFHSNLKLTYTNVFSLKKIGSFSPLHQIGIIIFLFLVSVCKEYYLAQILHQQRSYSFFTAIFAPLYEEILFRGLIFVGLTKTFSIKHSFILTSFFFGIWHLKNLLILTPLEQLYQVLYAGLIFAPITLWLVLKSKSIWPGVVFHYLNNLWAPISHYLFRLLIS